MKMLKKIWIFISEKAFEIVGVIGLIVMLMITFGSVLSRYVLPVSWAFTEELTCGLFILVSMVGAALGVERGKAMGISLITDHIPKRFTWILTFIQGAFTFLYGYLLLRYGIDMVKSEIRLHMKTAALKWPESIFGSFVPIGGAALMIASVCVIIKGIDQFKTSVTGRKLANSGEEK